MTNPDKIARDLAAGTHRQSDWSDAVPWPEPPRRIDLAIEGVRTVDGKMILPGALTWTKEPVPVTTREDTNVVGVVGKAQKFRRSENGVVSAEVWLHAEYGAGVDLDHVNTHIAITTVESGPTGITSGSLHGVYLSTASGAWPTLDRVHPATPVDPIFGPPFNLGDTWSPMKATRSCLRCGSLVLDEPEWLALHRKVHAQGWTR
jgi:hypothetical protein